MLFIDIPHMKKYVLQYESIAIMEALYSRKRNDY